jgi:hypothetical protein
LEEAQGELGLLAPDEEALLRNYRRLDVPTRAAIGLLVSRAAGPDLGQRDEVPPVARRAARREARHERQWGPKGGDPGGRD